MKHNATQRYRKRFYQNQGNLDVISKIRCTKGRLLDVGCGAGDNARLIARIFPDIEVIGITASAHEQKCAAPVMADCIISDIEQEAAPKVATDNFDCLLFSHVLEHVRDPSYVLGQFLPCVKNNGQVLIAVPNIAFYRARWKLLRGKFEYAASGIFDETHLRFFTYDTADKLILRNVEGLVLIEKTVSGSVPLWYLRRKVLSKKMSRALDSVGCRFFPNLFGGQVILDLERRSQ